MKKVLIANRGEIALRVIRACREMGVATVAVYSDADRGALHVLHADEAYRLGPAAAAESYLRGDLILAVARRAGADVAEAVRVAASIGYPVMLKAAAGGGGKGMRAVARAEELAAAFASASSEAERSFGSGEVYLEKLIERPRHIEIQLMADEHGGCVYLGERECSVQRRHQKVIEEAPSAVVSEDLRRRMGEAAVRLALSAGYVNAGTVEFLVDAEENFYFLEMNTRLQVEHPVTELVTGL